MSGGTPQSSGSTQGTSGPTTDTGRSTSRTGDGKGQEQRSGSGGSGGKNGTVAPPGVEGQSGSGEPIPLCSGECQYLSDLMLYGVPFPVGGVLKIVGPVTARGGAQVGKTVLGKFPDYMKMAESIGARRFNIPTSVWNKMSPAEQWAANQRFLDRAIARGDEILLSNPVKSIGEATGWFGRELQYLADRGYQLAADGMRMIR